MYSVRFMRHLITLLFASWAVASAQERSIDTSFRFAETNVTEVRDIELFADGSIAFGGSEPTSMGVVSERGDVEQRNFGGYALTVSDIAVEERDRAIYGGGSTQAGWTAPVRRVADYFDDSGWLIRGSIGGRAEKVLVQKPGRDVLVGGALTVPGITNEFYGLARLRPNGTVDSSFNLSGASGLNVMVMAATANGRILAGYRLGNPQFGSFGFGRWEANGMRDMDYERFNLWATSFGTNSHVTVIEKAPGTNGFVAAVQTEPLGAGGPKVTRIMWLDEEGLPVGHFEQSFEGAVNAIAFEAVRSETAAAQGYDHIVVGGSFTQIGAVQCNSLAAITKEGLVAWHFGANEGPTSAINTVKVQMDGRILIGGAFTNVSGLNVNRIARLNASAGASYLYWADNEFRGFEKRKTFDLSLRRLGDTNGSLSVTIAATPRGSATMADLGDYSTNVVFAPGQTLAVVAVGLVDDLFRENREMFDFRVSTTNGNILVTRPVTTLVILDDETPGTLDPTPLFEAGRPLSNFALQPDGKILVGLGGTAILRLNPDGTVDEGFVTNGIPSLAGQWEISGIQPQTNGQIYVGGKFNTTTNFGINHLARLNADGTLDTNFNPKLSALCTPQITYRVTFDVAPDGKLMVMPSSTIHVRIEGSQLNQSLYRLHPSGALDSTFSFTYPLDSTGTPSELDVLPNGETLIYSPRFNGVPGIGRIRTNGVINTNFFVRVPPSSGWVYDLEVAGDWLYFAGSFKSANGLALSNLARVNLTNGIVDTNFMPVFDSEVSAIRAHGEKLFVAGDFTTVNGQERTRVARLNLDGTLDATFDPGYGPNLRAGIIEIENDGSILTGIGFDYLDGVAVGPIVRLAGDSIFLPQPFPPIVEILSPANETNFMMTDAWFDLEIRVRATDVDNDVNEVVVELDGTPLSTNSAGGDFTVKVPMPSFAEHFIRVTARDATGLSASETVAFRVTNHAQGTVEARTVDGEVVIRYSGPRLQASSDLRTWSEVHTGGGDFKPSNVQPYRFFRASSP